MRWFAAFVATAVTVTLATVAVVVFEQVNGRPVDLPFWIRRFQVPIVFGVWAAYRLAFQWMIAYSGSQIEAAPRQDRFLDWVSATSMTLFHNPSRCWLTAYVAILGVALGAVGAYMWVFESSIVLRSAWALSVLFLATLVSAMAVPDPVDALVLPVDSEPESEPLLEVSEEQLQGSTDSAD